MNNLKPDTFITEAQQQNKDTLSPSRVYSPSSQIPPSKSPYKKPKFNEQTEEEEVDEVNLERVK